MRVIIFQRTQSENDNLLENSDAHLRLHKTHSCAPYHILWRLCSEPSVNTEHSQDLPINVIFAFSDHIIGRHSHWHWFIQSITHSEIKQIVVFKILFNSDYLEMIVKESFKFNFFHSSYVFFAITQPTDMWTGRMVTLCATVYVKSHIRSCTQLASHPSRWFLYSDMQLCIHLTSW